MEHRNPESPTPIRLVFELSRAEHPRLFDDLIRFHKGTKRVNRLRVLAYDGLLTQWGWLQSAASAPGERNAASASKSDASIGLFLSALDT